MPDPPFPFAKSFLKCYYWKDSFLIWAYPTQLSLPLVAVNQCVCVGGGGGGGVALPTYLWPALGFKKNRQSIFQIARKFTQFSRTIMAIPLLCMILR